MKIETRSLITDGLVLEFVTLDSPVNGHTDITMALDTLRNRVMIIYVQLDNPFNGAKFVEDFGKDRVIESFTSLELAEQFFNEMKQPLKLVSFVKKKMIKGI